MTSASTSLADGPICERCDGDGWVETWSSDGWVQGATDCRDCQGKGWNDGDGV